jgi:glycerophosphoryl diester phosphodiesterase
VSTATHPYLDWPGPIAFAHRGGNSEHPENTLPAFEHAVSLGYRYLETDVHLTADGVLVAFHDPDLSRTCNRPGNLVDLSWSEVSEALVDGREPIPLMADLLETFPSTRFNIDCKSDEAIPVLLDLLRERKAVDRVCVGSFSHKRLRTLRQRGGTNLLTCLSPREVASVRLTRRLAGAAPRIAQVPLQAGGSTKGTRVTIVNERFVNDAHRLGIPVHVWTINDPPEMRRLLDLGVDGIMTDQPEVLRDVLMERGEWKAMPLS